ncbi:MAG: hypothetical protein OXU64_08150 [Gemmatimonadota bacterium]|nr:hypothetical protein [Gemmatimonadota bacterium]
MVIRGLEESFASFGGVPVEMLFEQMKAVVLADGRHSGGRLVENPEFRGFGDHWGFRIRACRRYRAQTKDKVERPVRYVRGNFFYGRDLPSDDDLNARARQWLDEVANVRVHGTLGERIDDRFARERPLLGPLAPHRTGRSCRGLGLRRRRHRRGPPAQPRGSRSSAAPGRSERGDGDGGLMCERGMVTGPGRVKRVGEGVSVAMVGGPEWVWGNGLEG